MAGTFIQKKRLLPLVILLLGLLVRCLFFGQIPGGINQDEAFAGYEAWCLLNYGRDSAGYAFPVYFTAWGSGMNALESYLMLPFIALFGLKTWVIRLPQLIVAVLSLWVCYLTVRKLRDEKTALAALALLAICPWHIMLSRWGLESNLAPGFMLFGLYFFIKATENSRFLPLSALMYGLSLYCYATIWAIVPFLVLGQTIYCLYCKKLPFDRWLLLSGLILFSLALPLLLFLAINFGLIGEIRTEFFSIPKLLYMRTGEISLKNIPENLKNLLRLLWTQDDGLPWNSPGFFGQLYPLTLLFAALGLIDSVVRCKNKQCGLEPLLLMQLGAGLLLGILISVNVNRVNIIYIPIVILAACGLGFFCSLFGKKMKIGLILLYAVLFVLFQWNYTYRYSEDIAWAFDEGLEQALEMTEDFDGRVYLPEKIYYPKVLFYTEYPLDNFDKSVEYFRYPAAYLSARRFGKYVFGFDPAFPDPDSVYIMYLSSYTGPESEEFRNMGFSFEPCGKFVLAYMP